MLIFFSEVISRVLMRNAREDQTEPGRGGSGHVTNEDIRRSRGGGRWISRSVELNEGHADEIESESPRVEQTHRRAKETCEKQSRRKARPV